MQVHVDSFCSGCGMRGGKHADIPEKGRAVVFAFFRKL